MNPSNNKVFRRNTNISSIGLFYKNVGILWRVPDCEEISGGYSLEMMGMLMPKVLVFEVVIVCHCPICN